MATVGQHGKFENPHTATYWTSSQTLVSFTLARNLWQWLGWTPYGNVWEDKKIRAVRE